jgi:crotonobetainyl-CoA:carnitine CoA-transferase CaiB-like acyl-CoA transferase
VLPYNDRHWLNFFNTVGKAELADDPRFVNQPSRSKNIDALYGIVAEVMPTRTSAEWLKLLEEADIPVMPMNTPEDLFSCPHLTQVGMFPVTDHPTEGRIRHIKVPVHFSKTPGGYYRHPEQLGESTESVLGDVGYAPDEIAALRAQGVMGKARNDGP